jgi:hypothetical protein
MYNSPVPIAAPAIAAVPSGAIGGGVWAVAAFLVVTGAVLLVAALRNRKSVT